ncbi:MAG: extracellular solute-binding protein [Anaerolineae bacterium]|nr:extracellular solute-binding protein [Anaerolineae bacterium]
MQLAIVLVVGVIVLIGISGCQLPNSITMNNQDTPTIPATATIRPYQTPTVAITPTIAVTATTTPENSNTILTVWTIEAISPEADGDAGDFINNSLRNFRRANPDIEVDMILKKPGGKGGMLDFLRTSRQVAPTILPDVAILNATDLNQAYSGGLIQSLDGKLDRSIVQDLIPAARKMGTANEQLVGVPLGLDLEHTVYNTRTFTAPLVLWTDVLSSNSRYLFPAKGVNGLVNDTTLSFYLSNGGKLLDDKGLPTIDEPALRDVLNLYQQLLENGVINATALEAATTEELWPTYLEAKAGLTQISVRQYLTDRELLQSTSFAPLPVKKEGDIPVLIAHGWVMVLVTDDVERQRAALSLIEAFMSTSNNATWNSINKSIPTRDSAYQQLAGDDPYWVYLAEQLNSAQPQPGFVGYDQIGRIMQQAVQQVISGEATPEEAAATAVDALTP